MKLELKHLAPYLPYGLKVVTQYGLDVPKGGHIFEICGICERPDMAWKKGEIGLFFTRLGQNREMSNEYFEFRPALKPLSDYTDMLGLPMVELNCDIDDQIAIEQFANQQISLASLPYSAYEVLVRNKVDIFRLIPQNLAIDLNTLKP